MPLISLTEYANRIGRDPSVVRRKAIRGDFETAVKIGRNWVIDADEPYIDMRRADPNGPLTKAALYQRERRKKQTE
jgi:hypothetical protein